MRPSKIIGISSSGNRTELRTVKGFWFTVLAVVVILEGTTTARAGDKNLTVILRGNYTTSSKIFFNPDAVNQEQRSQYFQLDGVSGGGIELRYRWPAESFFLSLSVDYLSKKRDQQELVGFAGSSRLLPVTEGFYLLPVEFGVHTYIPLGLESLRMSMGGGIGAYYGAYVLRVAGVDAAMQNNPVKLGIHIVSGFEYQVLSGMWLRGDMRFRAPELKTISRYTQERAQYDGIDITFPRSDISTKISVDGMTFSLGVVVELF